MNESFQALKNGESIERARVPMLGFDDFREAVLQAVEAGQRVSALFGVDADAGAVDLVAVLADDAGGRLGVTQTRVRGSFPSLTPDCPQVHLFEREIAEQHAVVPEGHPWLKPVRFAPPLSQRAPGPGAEQIGVTDYYRVEGDEIHEVAVGPVHAGVIEPGHFRFQCHGEHVFHLEISLGYQHRGVERALLGGPSKRSVHYAETLAGDTTIGHTMAYAQAIESLSGFKVPARAQAIRGIALELERLANHTGDLGALAGDVGFLPTMSWCGRIRGDFLNLTALLCGSRFGRGLVRPGGVGFDLEPGRITDLTERLEAAARDVTSAVELLWETPSVMARFEDTGTLTKEQCDEIGLVGPAARACGAARDVRADHPCGIYRFSVVPTTTWHTGDVFARAWVRWLEVRHAMAFVAEQARTLPSTPIRVEVGPLRPERLTVSLVEGWRGEVCHVALTDAHGRFARYKVVDPSFHNWFGLALSLRGQQISDFPLCNKSYNLSYCGHDL